MQTIAIWGAASGLGAAMVDYYHELGFNVIAIARTPEKNPRLHQLNIRSISCDATNNTQVLEAVSQLPDGVVNLSSMGSFRADTPVDYIGHRNLINALEQHSHARFLLITSLGCGDSWKYLSERSKQGFGSAVREKSLAESWLQSSTLDYTILRPGGLKDGAATHNGVLSQHDEVHGLITRSDVARLTHELLSKPESIGEVFQCVDPNMTY